MKTALVLLSSVAAASLTAAEPGVKKDKPPGMVLIAGGEFSMGTEFPGSFSLDHVMEALQRGGGK